MAARNNNQQYSKLHYNKLCGIAVNDSRTVVILDAAVREPVFSRRGKARPS